MGPGASPSAKCDCVIIMDSTIEIRQTPSRAPALFKPGPSLLVQRGSGQHLAPGDGRQGALRHRKSLPGMERAGPGVNRNLTAGSALVRGGGVREQSWSRGRDHTLRALPADIMLQFVLGFTLGNVVGMYLAQNYDMPNLTKKLDEIKKDLEAKKKPPSS